MSLLLELFHRIIALGGIVAQCRGAGKLRDRCDARERRVDHLADRVDDARAADRIAEIERHRQLIATGFAQRGGDDLDDPEAQRDGGDLGVRRAGGKRRGTCHASKKPQSSRFELARA